ncbi:hypothetical protein EII41_12985 [Tannerella forsythia]|uniref:Uncharacterized protein n=1 Tax=Tannerella forsythia TaxID=28112 RepID=A0A3P1YHJ0_TANFO|nr:hypothetical protein EII41_12985 [Tannerella forsythia]
MPVFWAYPINRGFDFRMKRFVSCPEKGCQKNLRHDASHKRTKNVAQIMDIIQKINLLIIERLKTNIKP